MVTVYLKNGEKAPMPDATHVKLEPAPTAAGDTLRCFFNDREVGAFKWDEVAGYTISVLDLPDVSPTSAYQAWGVSQP